MSVWLEGTGLELGPSSLTVGVEPTVTSLTFCFPVNEIWLGALLSGAHLDAPFTCPAWYLAPNPSRLVVPVVSYSLEIHFVKKKNSGILMKWYIKGAYQNAWNPPERLRTNIGLFFSPWQPSALLSGFHRKVSGF